MVRILNGLRQYTVYGVAIVLLALPAIGSLILYEFTKNPYLRPLGISKDEVAAVDGQIEAVSIEVQIRYGVGRNSRPSKADLLKLLSDTFSTRTDAFHFVFQDVDGEDIAVTFSVGPNRYGPYPPAGMIDGVVSALTALEYTQRVNSDD